MKNIREVLQDADPLRHEPAWPSDQRDFAAWRSLRQLPVPTRPPSRDRGRGSLF